jgi:cobalt/nickel transport system permease protein
MWHIQPQNKEEVRKEGEGQMHIPDGFLDLWIVAVMYIVSAAVIGFSAWKLKGKLEASQTPLIGIVAAGIFAAQMLNWPIPGGTSAHFVGGSIAGILLGPYAGCLSMVSVLTIQSLIFGDGGITALGANIFNMAIVAVFVGYWVFRALRRYNQDLALFLAGWLGIWLGAIAAGVEIGASSIFAYELGTTISVMGIWHGALGIIEGIITMLAVRYVLIKQPELVPLSREVVA